MVSGDRAGRLVQLLSLSGAPCTILRLTPSPLNLSLGTSREGEMTTPEFLQRVSGHKLTVAQCIVIDCCITKRSATTVDLDRWAGELTGSVGQTRWQFDDLSDILKGIKLTPQG